MSRLTLREVCAKVCVLSIPKMQKSAVLKERLVFRRNALGMTQTDLAERSGVGLRSISNYEAGELPTLDKLFKIAEALGVTPGYFLGEELKEVSIPSRASSRLVGYSELPTEQLEKLLSNMANKLKTFSAHERKHVLGNLHSIIDELEERELKPSPAAAGSKLLHKGAEGVKGKPSLIYPKHRSPQSRKHVSSARDVADELGDAIQEELDKPPGPK